MELIIFKCVTFKYCTNSLISYGAVLGTLNINNKKNYNNNEIY